METGKYLCAVSISVLGRVSAEQDDYDRISHGDVTGAAGVTVRPVQYPKGHKVRPSRGVNVLARVEWNGEWLCK